MAKNHSAYSLSRQWYFTHAGVIFTNLIPLLGAILLGWKPLLVILMYAMETIIAGIFNVFKMGMVIGSDSSISKSSINTVVGWGLIPFFLLHYNFFVLIQLSFLFGLAEMWGSDIPEGVFNLPAKISFVLSSEVTLGLGVIVSGYFFDFIQKYLVNKRHLEMEAGQQMMEVYPRILVQQFVVILGGWFLLVPYSEYFVLALLVALKTYAELLMIEKGNAIFQPSTAK